MGKVAGMFGKDGHGKKPAMFGANGHGLAPADNLSGSTQKKFGQDGHGQLFSGMDWSSMANKWGGMFEKFADKKDYQDMSDEEKAEYKENLVAKCPWFKKMEAKYIAGEIEEGFPFTQAQADMKKKKMNGLWGGMMGKVAGMFGKDGHGKKPAMFGANGHGLAPADNLSGSTQKKFGEDGHGVAPQMLGQDGHGQAPENRIIG